MTSGAGIEVGSRLFLTAAPDLPTGSQLSPGHWLPHVESMTLARRSPDGALTWDAQVLHVLLELACEATRLREFPDFPSRLECLFLWEDEEDARAWHYRRHLLQGSNAGLYEVEVVACHRVLAADFNLVSYLAGETAGSLMEQARRYWRGERTGSREVLLEGNVVVCRNLLAFPGEALETVKDPLIDPAMHAAIRWVDPGEPQWSLTPGRAGRYHLEGRLAAEASLPMSIAGWHGIELEERSEPILARRGAPPLLVKPGEACVVDVDFTDLPPLTIGTRYRPVLVCNRSAAYYWQLQPYWEGRLVGNWLVVDERR